LHKGDTNNDDDDNNNNNNNLKLQKIYHEKQNFVCHKL